MCAGFSFSMIAAKPFQHELNHVTLPVMRRRGVGEDEQLHAAQIILVNVGGGSYKHLTSVASLKNVRRRSLFLNASNASRHSRNNDPTSAEALTMASGPQREKNSVPARVIVFDR